MTTLFAQAVTTPATPPDVSTYVQSVFQQLMGIDVFMLLKVVGIWIFLIWFVFALWVAFDAASRYKQWPLAFVWFLFVLPFNFFGFIGYLFMRPVITLEEKQWTKLESKYLMHELSNVNDCPTCGTLVPITHNYCAACGTAMNVNCAKCDNSQSIYNSFCSHCGEKLTALTKEDISVKTQGEVVKKHFFTRLGSFVLGAKNAVTGAFSNSAKKVSGTFKKKPKKTDEVKEVEPEVTQESTETKS